MDAAYTCTTGAVGTLSFSEIYVETTGILAHYTGSDRSCSFTGTLGGARRK